MEIIDFHAHIYPQTIAERAVRSIGDFYSIGVDRGMEGTATQLCKIGKEAGISHSVVHSVAVSPKHVKNINNFIAAECENHKEFIGFGTIHASYENPAQEIERIISLGLHGIKIHPDTQRFNMDSDEMMKIYEMIEGKLPILIHCGDYRYDYSHPHRLATVLDAFPNLVVIAAHFGGWSLFDLALEYLENRNCYLDLSSSLMYTGNKRGKELIKIYGAERILFGSDYPMQSPKDELSRFMGLGLSDEENNLILSENAKRILRI